MTAYQIFILCFLISCSTWAIEVGETLPLLKFENQFEDSMTLSSRTQLIFFASDRESSKIMTEYLKETSTDPETYGAIYVANTSKMPGLIFKMMALPKMRKLSFKIAIDRDGSLTKSWPHEENKITLLELNQLKVQKVKYLNSKTDLSDLFKQLTKK